MIKSKFKKIGIVVLVLVGIFALLTFGDWIILKIQGLDVRIKFEATNTEVKVTSVMYGNDDDPTDQENINRGIEFYKMTKSEGFGGIDWGCSE